MEVLRNSSQNGLMRIMWVCLIFSKRRQIAWAVYSLPMIGALLGHTQAQTTLRYAHLATDHLRKAAEDISNHIAASTPKQSEPTPSGQARLRVVK